MRNINKLRKGRGMRNRAGNRCAFANTKQLFRIISYLKTKRKPVNLKNIYLDCGMLPKQTKDALLFLVLFKFVFKKTIQHQTLYEINRERFKNFKFNQN